MPREKADRMRRDVPIAGFPTRPAGRQRLVGEVEIE
jgi:hypothetical protein